VLIRVQSFWLRLCRAGFFTAIRLLLAVSIPIPIPNLSQYDIQYNYIGRKSQIYTFSIKQPLNIAAASRKDKSKK